MRQIKPACCQYHELYMLFNYLEYFLTAHAKAQTIKNSSLGVIETSGLFTHLQSRKVRLWRAHIKNNENYSQAVRYH